MSKSISDIQFNIIDEHISALKNVMNALEDKKSDDQNSIDLPDFPGFVITVEKNGEVFDIINLSGAHQKYFKEFDSFKLDFFQKYMSENDFIVLRKNVVSSLDKNKKLRSDFRFINEDEKKINWFEIIFHPEKKQNRILLIFIENTERKESEEQERLLMELDKSSSLKSLVSCIAHEVNNPNHNIMQNISLLENGWQDIMAKLDEYYEEHGDFNIRNVQYSNVRDYLGTLLEKILNSSRQIKTIIDDLRMFSQKSQNMLVDQVNLNSLVQQTVELLRQQINKATTNFKEMYASEMVPLLGNFKQIQQVVINLLHNSFDAIEKPDDEIKIFTFYNPVESNVGIGVSDKGKGMTPEDVNNIFNHFYRLKSGKSGGGLGLPISKEIIDMHQGTIDIDSKVGKGTTVIIKFPVKVGRK